MTTVLQVGDRTISSDDLFSLLTHYELLPQLIREIIVDRAIEPFTCYPDECIVALQEFYGTHNIMTEPELQTWLERSHLNLEELRYKLERRVRIRKFQEATWGPDVKSYFLKRKASLDQVIFSMISVPEKELAMNLYFQLQKGGRDFAELAAQYNQETFVSLNGLVGPIALGQLDPILRQRLNLGRVGQLWVPTRVKHQFVIVRLEKRIEVQLTDTLRQQLLQELYKSWLEKQLEMAKLRSLSSQQLVAA
ncbi:MAG: peptidylprolyl isomerase [Leptolyngbyaceae cyanobacterium bins.59]|nr:peptidylprolyl isomerase [Leptolyngbyaceae cyanobacterium bins.59]